MLPFISHSLRRLKPVAMATSFKPGDRVQWLDEDLEGRGKEIRPETVLVLTTQGFEMSVPAGALVRIPDTVEITGPRQPLPAKDAFRKGSKRRMRGGKKQRFSPALEVDLHIEKLVPDPSGLNPFEMLDRQLEVARGQLEFALRKRIQRL